MSLRGFFLWFWGIVIGSGVAAGATLAMLKAPGKPAAAPPAPSRSVALADPLPVPPLPALIPVAAPTGKISESRPRATVIRAGRSHRARHATRVAEERITVLPPIPPQHAEARSEHPAHPTRLASSRRAVRPKERTGAAPAEARPGPRALAYARAYRRYSYYTYSFPYSYSYPYRYSYFYRY